MSDAVVKCGPSHHLGCACHEARRDAELAKAKRWAELWKLAAWRRHDALARERERVTGLIRSTRDADDAEHLLDVERRYHEETKGYRQKAEEDLAESRALFAREQDLRLEQQMLSCRLVAALRKIDIGRHTMNATEMAAIAYDAIQSVPRPDPIAEIVAATENANGYDAEFAKPESMQPVAACVDSADTRNDSETPKGSTGDDDPVDVWSHERTQARLDELADENGFKSCARMLAAHDNGNMQGTMLDVELKTLRSFLDATRKG